MLPWRNFGNISSCRMRKKVLWLWNPMKLLSLNNRLSLASFSLCKLPKISIRRHSNPLVLVFGEALRGVTIKEVGQNLFLAIFGSEDHLQEIIDKSPWSFDIRLILMKRFFGDISPAKVTFTHSLFWIRIFNIPIKSMN